LKRPRLVHFARPVTASTRYFEIWSRALMQDYRTGRILPVFSEVLEKRQRVRVDLSCVLKLELVGGHGHELSHEILPQDPRGGIRSWFVWKTLETNHSRGGPPCAIGPAT
jgi:hypothetical protein